MSYPSLVVLLIIFIFGPKIPPTRLLLFNQILLITATHGTNAVGNSGWLANAIRNLTTPNQGDDDAGADNECEHEAVYSVPLWGPASGLCASIVVVEEDESQELRDKCVLHREKQGRPGYGCADDSDEIAGVALLAAVLGPFQTPVNSAEEGEDLSECQAFLLSEVPRADLPLPRSQLESARECVASPLPSRG